MKKILAVLTVFSTMLLLAGCQQPIETTPVESSPLPTETDLQTLTVLVYDIEDALMFEEVITYEAGDERTTLELIEDHVEIIYATFDGLGVFVYGVGGFFPTEYNVTYNYFLKLYVDGTESMMGIDQIALEDGMTITFKEATFLDPVDIMVDQVIYHFINTHLESYVQSTYMHHDVLAAIAKLYTMGYALPDFLGWTSLDIGTYIDGLGTETIAQNFKKLIIQKIYGQDFSETLTNIEAFEATNVYDASTLLQALFVGHSISEQIDTLVASLLTTTPTFMDPDYVGMFMQAMSPHGDALASTDIMETYLNYLYEQQTIDGISSYGSANAASTATVILGLVAQGIHPRSEAFTVDGIDLIEALLAYHTEDGFKWLLTSDTPDLDFSTPQAFAALVVYKIYRDTWENPPIYLYDVIDITEQS